MAASVSASISANRIHHKVNHVSLVVDKSGSMRRHEAQLVRVVDEFVKGLQEESDRLGHETRISLYAFDHEVHNLVWDMDVKHLPSLRGLYAVDNGATALIEAAVKSVDDLKHIWEGYGEHSFLQVVVTDGEENASGCSEHGLMHTRMKKAAGTAVLRGWMDRIRAAMDELPEHWTSAILVPNSLAKRTAQEYGFPAGNIAVWDADSSGGVEEAIDTVKTAATTFLRGREKGVRGTKRLFAMGQDLSAAEVKAELDALETDTYVLVPVDRQAAVREFVTGAGHPYRTGCSFYELSKREKIQGGKQIAVAEKDPATGALTGRVFTGPAARGLLGLPAAETTVKPGDNPAYTVFVQSTSVNRKLVPGTRLLVML
ncbi:vWA domain-containing protein [Kitasatospora phosalacinea]|uniref:vWA domain-containing protein n=1 Tax=Kitasatospora phosalacinea TaxID=2065 RepID=UPI0009DEECC3|nr:vWA domain-containing protein [Kitasatospora phosalacinea]